MAVRLHAETRSGWREAHDQIILQHRLEGLPSGVQVTGGKHMDRNALVPFDEISVDEVRFQRGVWLAYDFMISKRPRRFIQERINKEVMGFAQTVRTAPLQVTSLGAGSGRVDRELIQLLRRAGLSSHFTLVDQSAVALNEATQHLQKTGFKGRPGLNAYELSASNPRTNAEFLQSDAKNTPLPDNSQDVVTSINVTHHLTTPEVVKLADEIARIAKDGGKFTLVDTHPLPLRGLRRKAIDLIIKLA